MFGNQRHIRRATRRANDSAKGQRRVLSLKLIKLGIGLITGVGAILVIQAGGPPFPYRLGQASDREIRAKVRFEKENLTRTELNRAQAADGVRPIYANDPSHVAKLHEEVRELIKVIGKTKKPEQVPRAITEQWELLARFFPLLRQTADTPDKLHALEGLVAEIFQGLQTHGILDPNDERQGTRQASELQVQTSSEQDGDEQNLVTWKRDQVDPEKLLAAEGPIKQRLAEGVASSVAGEAWFDLLQPRLKQLRPTLTYEAGATELAKEAARAAVPVEKDTYSQGELLVPQGESIDAERLELLRSEHQAYVATRRPIDRLQRTASLTVLVLAFYALAGYYIVRFERRLAGSPIRLVLLGVLMVAALGLAKLLKLLSPQLYTEIIPIVLAAMTLTIVYGQQFGLLVAFSFGLLCAWMFGTGVAYFVVLTGGTAAAVLSLTSVRSRTKLIIVGGTAGLTYFALTWATGLLTSQSHKLLLWDSGWGLACGVLAGFLMSGSLPFLEKLFGIVTDMNLLELSDVSHPLLQELMRKAPGTYNHSCSVATLAETAAEAIAANALLVRVGSYFHDVGKMLKPHYFVENQTDSVNRHESLHPTMSTLIIIGHVKDGVELAREHHLPEAIIDFIEQHHGTTLVEYFYHEATRDADAGAEREEEVQEAAFRYPGPKPQTKEGCVVMLADAVESASRTLSEPTPARIERLVGKLTLNRLLDGQFEQCGITLQEIGIIKESLIKSLNAIYHGRVKYPEQQIA